MKYKITLMPSPGGGWEAHVTNEHGGRIHSREIHSKAKDFARKEAIELAENQADYSTHTVVTQDYSN